MHVPALLGFREGTLSTQGLLASLPDPRGVRGNLLPSVPHISQGSWVLRATRRGKQRRVADLEDRRQRPDLVRV